MPVEDNAALDQLRNENSSLQNDLHNRESEIAALLGVPPQPVIARFDRDLRHTYVNASVKLATGIASEDYIGRTSAEMGMPDRVLLIFEGALREVFKTNTEKTIEYSIVMAGTRWTFQSRMVPETDQQHRVVSVLAVTRDITRQKRAETALLENYEILETVHRVGQALASELDLRKLLQTITDSAIHVTNADYAVFVSNQFDAQGRYIISTVSGPPPEIFARFPIVRTNDVFGITLRDGQKLQLDDIRADQRFAENLPLYDVPDGYHPIRSYLAVPVRLKSSEVLGALCLGHAEVHMFSERHERIIEGLAAQAAIAIDNARLYEDAQNQREHLQTTLASIGDAVIATDAGGLINFINPVAQALTGWSEQDAVGLSLERVFRIINEGTRQTVENPVTKVIREGKVVGLANHTLLVARDGHETPIDDSGAPIFDEHRHLLGVILVFRDITERKQNEHALQASEARYRMLIEQASDAILIAREHGPYIEANSAACELLGYTRDEILQMNMPAMFVIEPDRPLRDAELQQGKTLVIEREMIRKDGSRFPVEVSTKLLGDGLVQAIARDITGRKRSEQRMNLLLELSDAFSKALTMNEIAEVVVDRALNALNGLLGTVALLSDDGRSLQLLNLRGLSPETAEKYRHTPLDFPGPLNDAIRADHIMWIENREQYTRLYPQFADIIQRNGSQSTVCIPLRVNDRLIGGFNLSFADEKPRTPDEEAFFVALAQQCAQSLERARLYEIEKGRS